MKKAIILLPFLFGLKAFSQSVSGYWYGSANVNSKSSTNNYLVELIVHQERTLVRGVINYYFKKTFRSIKVNGNYNSLTRQLTLFNIPVTYHGSMENLEVDCMMDFGATLRVAKAGSNLIGAFQAKPEYKNGCADINFNLHLNADISKEDSILHAIKVYKETNQVWRPTYEDTLVAVVRDLRRAAVHLRDDAHEHDGRSVRGAGRPRCGPPRHRSPPTARCRACRRCG